MTRFLGIAHRLALVFVASVTQVMAQIPLGSAFTYQGQLADVGIPATGNYDFQFGLFDAPTEGTQLGGTISQSGVGLSGGFFTVTLDFGADVFGGAAQWLEVRVRPAGSMGAYTPLAPRQRLTPTPNAILSLRAMSAAALQGRAVDSTLPATGQVLTWNGSQWAPASGGGGTVTNIATGGGLTGGPITTSGTVAIAFPASWTGNSGSPWLTVTNNGGTGIQASGTTYGFKAIGSSSPGIGVFGEAAGLGQAFGVQGVASFSTQGRGVYGTASAPSGTTYGVYGESFSTSGVGVYGNATASAGTAYGVFGKSSATAGVRGEGPVGISAVGDSVGLSASGPSFGFAALFTGKVRVSTLQGTGNRAVYSDALGELTNSPSDAILKRDVVSLSDERDVIGLLRRLRGVSFNWDTSSKRAAGLGEQREIGMIAQEVEAVLPELVGIGADGYRSLDYAKLSAYLVEVAKTQQAEIERHRSLLTVQQDQLTALKRQLASIQRAAARRN